MATVAGPRKAMFVGRQLSNIISTPSMDATFTLAIPAIALGRSSGFQESCFFAEAD